MDKREALKQIKYIRLQVDTCVKVEFVNGSMACSCGMIRGVLPNLRDRPNE